MPEASQRLGISTFSIFVVAGMILGFYLSNNMKNKYNIQEIVTSDTVVKESKASESVEKESKSSEDIEETEKTEENKSSQENKSEQKNFSIDEIVVNTDENDLSTDMSSIPYGPYYIYAHFNIISGPSDKRCETYGLWMIEPIGEKQHLRYESKEIIYDDGSNTGNCRYYDCQWHDNSYIFSQLPKGTYKISIYEAPSSYLLGEKTIKLNKSKKEIQKPKMNMVI